MPSTSYFERQSERKVSARTRMAKSETAEYQVECTKLLTPGLLEAWHEFRICNPALDNGCFHPEFAKAVERVRDDVEYAVIRGDGEIRGLFPFQRISSRVGKPVGGLMNDFHGLICAPETDLTLADVVKKAGLGRFDFHALLVNSPATTSQTRKVATNNSPMRVGKPPVDPSV